MLLKAPPLHFPGRFRDGDDGVLGTSLHPRLHCSNGGNFILSKVGTRWTVAARAGYVRKPMEMPGAYQLVDEETGESFIVWGDPDSPIPSKEVLSWKPNKESPSRDGMGETAVRMGGGSVGSFDRLKAQCVRALMKKRSTQTKRGDVEESHQLGVENNTPTYKGEHLSSETEFSARKRDVTMHGEKRITSRTDRVSQMTNQPVMVPEQAMRPTKADSSGMRDGSALKGWNDAGSMRDTGMHSTGYSKQPRRITNDGGFFSRKSFKELGCSPDMISSLKGQLFLRPSHIQAMAYADVLEGKSCILADQSGSGKTLAYLAPIIQRMRQEELSGISKSSSCSPRILILVPTAELASQVLKNCRSISKYGVPFRSMVATGGFRQKTQLESLQQDLDVLIATPGRFLFLLQEGFLRLNNLKCAVLDEVDILFGDEGFEQVLQSLISSGPVATQYLFVTATLPLDIYNKLVEIFPDCEVIMGPGMHRTSSGLEEVLVDCSGKDGDEKTPETAFLNKKSALMQLAEENPVPKTIIFCNKIETCRKVENVLKRFDRQGSRIKVLPFHAALAQDLRVANMKEFLSSDSKDSLFLICTDRASRGIDFVNINHVVLFDFPRDPSEYVRRVGRTARGAGGKGKAFVFVVGKQVALARRIIERNMKGHPLHDVPNAYELSTSLM
ncbi:DEAD-box ATP-dependent RNA helicase 50 [Acorus calamus]|uniref:DEAD-box ATP-dependent RNA helicase 50 n=1 Tax=Acorus calamus TaxID=4465 RepID=A0AAV9EYG5_ACOCL|nr:DEAD-box ATP-dependent RNA helicase 50 [Acorus calamus]